jgi:hypothetical protein
LGGIKVSAPRGFGYDMASNPENEVGATYFVMGILEGMPYDPQMASEEVKKRVLKGW